MLLYKENPKDIAKKLPELLNKFSRLTIYKINMYKSVVFLYANSKLTKREMKAISFPLPSKLIKYLGINLTKDVKDLYSENYEELKKEIEEDTNKWKHIPCLWISRLNIIKMPKLPKAIDRFNAIPIMVLLSNHNLWAAHTCVWHVIYIYARKISGILNV